MTEESKTLRNLLESIIQGVVMFDSSRRLVAWNKHYEKNLQFPDGFLEVGMSNWEMLLFLTDRGDFGEGDPEKLARSRLDLLWGGSSSRVETNLRGATFDVLFQPMRDGGLVITYTDITELKRIQTELEERKAGLEEAVAKRTEALARSEHRFRDFANAASDWFWEMGPDLQFTYLSERYFEITGDRPEDKIGTTRTRYVDAKDLADDEEKWAAHFAALKAQQPFKNFEYAFKVRDGSSRLARTSGMPVFAADGDFVGYRGIGTDITASKQAEQALRAGEQRFRATFEQAAVGIAHVGTDGTWLRVNRRLCDMLGYDEEELLALRFQHITAPDTLEADVDRFERLLRGEEKTYRTEKRYIRKDGSLVWANLTSSLVRGADDEPSYFVSVIEDISERKRAEQALRESEARLAKAAKMAKIGYWLWDVFEDKALFFSDELVKAFGAASNAELEAMFSSTPAYLARVHPDDRERYAEADRASKAEKRRCEIEYRIVDATGETHHLYQIMEPVLDEQGEVVGFNGVTQNITEEKRAEEILRQAQRMEAIGQLTAGVAHDFNNVLGVISGNAELLEDELGADNPQLATVHRAAKRAAELTQHLLAYSRKQVLNPEIININSLIADTTGLLRRTLEEHIDIETVTATGLWNCEVDPAQLENALLNLAINARDAMPDGGKLTIETTNARLDDAYAAAQAEVTPGQYVMLAVTDTGTGMPAEIRDHVFEPFFTTKAVGTGSGLGLSMVYGFVKQSGGHVTVYSEPGEGTTIKLYLPHSTKTETVERKPVTDEVPVARGETVLVVEDDPDLRTLVVSLLGKLGYRVMEGATAADALEQLGSTTRETLLLTDVVLSGDMNGRQLATEAERRAPGIKVLYMSGYTENAIVHHGRLDTDAALLQKPFRRVDLARAVRRAIDSSSP